MKKIVLSVFWIIFVNQIYAQPPITLGTQMDGFGYTNPTIQQLKVNYKKWSKTASNTGVDFLFQADNFFNKWTASNVSLNSQYTLNWYAGSNGNPPNIPNGTLSNVTSGWTYTFKFKVEPGYTNLDAIVMATSSVPAILSSRVQTPDEFNVREGETVTVILTLSSAPSIDEKFYLRYSIDNFMTYGTLKSPDSGSGSTQVFTIPSFPAGTTVHYYLFSSTVSTNLSGNEPFTDLATINILRAQEEPTPQNFSYVVQAPLPIELTSFHATQTGQNNILLTWRTASERNNAYFEPERSADGRTWAALGRVGGSGTTLQPQEYNFRDDQPLMGLNYYRLRQVDFDGAYAYSGIVVVNLGLAAHVARFYPNPVVDELYLVLPKESEGVAFHARIYSLDGKRVPTPTLAGSRLDVSGLQPGVYLLKLEQEGKGIILVNKFVKR